MTPRSFIGKQFEAVMAETVEAGDEIVISTFNADQIVRVREARIVGDDVEINVDSPHWSEITTSRGNAVMVVVK